MSKDDDPKPMHETDSVHLTTHGETETDAEPTQIDDDSLEQLETLVDQLQNAELVNQSSRSHGGGATSSNVANVELHVHLGDQYNVQANGDSAIDKIKNFFRIGRADEDDQDQEGSN